MKRCWSLIPPRFEDKRHEAIERGLARHGYHILRETPRAPAAGDVITTWNCHAAHIREAVAQVKAAGGRHVVAEEGYTRWTWPAKHFALALDGHNGAGRWFIGGPERWEAMGLDVKPWRASSAAARIVVREQRGIGTPEMRSPPDWHIGMAETLRRRSGRPVAIRRHPKLQPVHVPAERDLAGAHALVTWGSSDAVRALIAGIPVFYCAPHCIVAGGALPGIAALEEPQMSDTSRLDALRRMSWAQWTQAEIEAGTPFEHLLSL